MTHDWKVGEWYKTRGGYEVQLLDVDYKGLLEFCMIGKIKFDDREQCAVWCRDGSFHSKGNPHKHDLMLPVETKELWLNVYHNRSTAYRERSSADEYAANGRIGLLKITIIGDDYEVERVAIC